MRVGRRERSEDVQGQVEQRNPYEVLALSKWATESEIEDAYERLRDLAKGDEAHLTDLDRAREALNDPERRARWDLETYAIPLSDPLRSYVLPDMDPWGG